MKKRRVVSWKTFRSEVELNEIKELGKLHENNENIAIFSPRIFTNDTPRIAGKNSIRGQKLSGSFPRVHFARSSTLIRHSSPFIASSSSSLRRRVGPSSSQTVAIAIAISHLLQLYSFPGALCVCACGFFHYVVFTAARLMQTQLRTGIIATVYPFSPYLIL